MYRDDEESARVLAEALASELAQVSAERDELREEVDELRAALGLAKAERDTFAEQARRARSKDLGVKLERLRQAYLAHRANNDPAWRRAALMERLRNEYEDQPRSDPGGNRAATMEKLRQDYEADRARRLGLALHHIRGLGDDSEDGPEG